MKNLGVNQRKEMLNQFQQWARVLEPSYITLVLAQNMPAHSYFSLKKMPPTPPDLRVPKLRRIKTHTSSSSTSQPLSIFLGCHKTFHSFLVTAINLEITSKISSIHKTMQNDFTLRGDHQYP